MKAMGFRTTFITLLFFLGATSAASAGQLLLGAGGSYSLLGFGSSPGEASSFFAGPGFSGALKFRTYPFASNSNNGLDFFVTASRVFLFNTQSVYSEKGSLTSFGGGMDLRVKSFYAGVQADYSSAAIVGTLSSPRFRYFSVGPRVGVNLRLDQGLYVQIGGFAKFGNAEISLPLGRVMQYIQEYGLNISVDIALVSSKSTAKR